MHATVHGAVQSLEPTEVLCSVRYLQRSRQAIAFDPPRTDEERNAAALVLYVRGGINARLCLLVVGRSLSECRRVARMHAGQLRGRVINDVADKPSMTDTCLVCHLIHSHADCIQHLPRISGHPQTTSTSNHDSTSRG